ncbi:MAG: META domain-containing protein [Chitinophagaceae bacterium]
MRTVLLTSLLPLLLAAFGSNHAYIPSPAAAASPSALDTSKWYLVKIYSDTGTIDVTDKYTYIRFDTVAGKAGGKGGCNSFGCSVTTTGTSMKIAKLFSTKMYCPDRHSAETSFFYHLQNVTSYTVHENKLVLLVDGIAVLELLKE